jgi:DNA-binding MarR family transcriptional regulator
MSMIDQRHVCYHRGMTSARPRSIAVAGAPELAADLSFLLARANALSLAAGNAALAPFGLKARSYSVLALASGDARPAQRDLAEYLRLDPSQVVALVDDLQAKGLVTREPDPTDRRANVVVATPEGVRLFRDAERAAHDAERTLHADLSDAERVELGRLLARLAFPG